MRSGNINVPNKPMNRRLPVDKSLPMNEPHELRAEMWIFCVFFIAVDKVIAFWEIVDAEGKPSAREGQHADQVANFKRKKVRKEREVILSGVNTLAMGPGLKTHATPTI